MKANTKPISDSFLKTEKKAPLILLGLLVMICLVVYREYIFGHYYFYFRGIGSDSLNYSYPYIYGVADYISKTGIPKWSFHFGMGRNLFPFILQDPFDVFLYLGGKDNILYLTVYKEILKVILSGMVFFYYLRLLKLSDFTAITGSLLFAFCGFKIVGSCWYIFSFEAFNVALMLLAFELLFTRGKWFLFPFVIFLTGISQPFNLYLNGVFIAMYALLRLFYTESFTVRNVGALFLKMAGLGIIGMLLSGPFLLENMAQVLESPRGSGVNSFAHILAATPLSFTMNKFLLGASIMRWFSNDILGPGSHYNGAWNYLETPAFYIGLPCLLLMPQVFSFLKTRLKIVFIIFIIIWVLPMVFPYYRYAFWLFSGDYFRAYSFFISIFFLFYSLIALDNIIKFQKINLPVLLTTLAVLFFALNYPYYPPQATLYFEDRESIYRPIWLFVSIGIVVYTIVLFFFRKSYSAGFIKYVFFVLVIFEITYLNNFTLNNMEQLEVAKLSKDSGYKDHQQDAINILKQTDHSIFRIDKATSSSPARFGGYNDGMVQDYLGTSAYNSFNQLHYIFYYQLMGISDRSNEAQSRWAIGFVNRPIMESENSVKYILTKSYTHPMWQIAFDSITTFGDVKLFKNKYCLPLGYTYNYFIKESIFSPLFYQQKDLVSLQTCVIRDDYAGKVTGLKEFKLADTLPVSTFNAEIYSQLVNNLKKDTLTITKFEENFISGTINLKEDKMMYLSIPYDDGWKLTVDGHPAEKVILSAGMTGVRLQPGYHKVEMAYELRYFRKGLLLSLFGIVLYTGILFFKIRK